MVTEEVKVEIMDENIPEPQYRKVLIFSKYTTTLKFVRHCLFVTRVLGIADTTERDRDALLRKFEDEELPIFEGKLSPEKRTETLRKFEGKQGHAELFVQLAAGGFGLNITCATYVLFLDPPWSPSEHSQCVDRAHRIGQKHIVRSFNV